MVNSAIGALLVKLELKTSELSPVFNTKSEIFKEELLTVSSNVSTSTSDVMLTEKDTKEGLSASFVKPLAGS